ncbi:MAG TPA: helix-turn-helix transcriptional regulator [Acidimicrobiales bacterium]|nr:helix-turn-helix transcriptional regulator [Acidimicrobiales bacterium]
MPSYSIGQAAELLGVSADTLRRWVDGGRLAATKGVGGRRLVDGEALASLAESLTSSPDLSELGLTSARNRFIGLVTSVTKDTVMAKVDMICGPHRVVSLISREAADDLGLVPGMVAIASVKATNVAVELPRT